MSSHMIGPSVQLPLLASNKARNMAGFYQCWEVQCQFVAWPWDPAVCSLSAATSYLEHLSTERCHGALGVFPPPTFWYQLIGVCCKHCQLF